MVMPQWIKITFKVTNTMNKESETLLDKWVRKVNHGGLDEILSLYSETASFFPTFCKELKSSDDRELYFKGLKSKSGLKVETNDDQMTKCIAGNIWVAYGTYTFSYAENDQVVKYPSRYTIIYDLSFDKPILHHHSSIIPL